MAHFQLVLIPLFISFTLIFLSFLFFIWFKRRLRESNKVAQGVLQASLFGFSLMGLAGFSLFISLFFLITG